MKTRALLAAAVAVALLLAAAPGAHGQQADPPPFRVEVELGFGRFEQMLVDESRGQIYVTLGYGSNSMHVLGLDGAPIAVVGNLPDNAGMHLSDRGLWVALGRADKVALIDPDSLTEIDRIGVPQQFCPVSVVETADKLVVGGTCGNLGVGVIDLLSDAPMQTARVGPDYSPILRAVPGRPNVVVGGDRGLSPTTLEIIDVSTGTPVELARRRSTGSNLRDIAVDPAGEMVIQASGSPYEHSAWSLEDLSLRRTYPTSSYPIAAAWSADGTVVAAAIDGDPSLSVFRADQPDTPVDTRNDFGGIQGQGLVLSADGQKIWALTNGFGDGTNAVLQIVAGVIRDGDANGDGKLEPVDVLAVLNKLVDQPPPAYNAANADIDDDGLVSVLDALAITRCIDGSDSSWCPAR